MNIFPIGNLSSFQIKTPLPLSYKNHKQSLVSDNTVLNEFISAIKYNHLELLPDLFFKYGNIKDDNGLTPLKIAILCNNREAVNKILMLSEFCLDSTSILATACEINDNHIIKQILEIPTLDINSKGGSSNESPLFYTILNNNLEIGELLLKKNITLQKHGGASFFFQALSSQRCEFAELLLDFPEIILSREEIELVFNKGTDSLIRKFLIRNKDNSIDKINDLFLNIISRHDISINTLECFYKHMDINHQDPFKNTALLYVCASGNLDKLKSLLTAFSPTQIDLSLTNYLEMNAFMCCIEKLDTDCVNYLINYIKQYYGQQTLEKIISQKNKHDENCLLLALKKDNLELVKLLKNNFTLNFNCCDYLGISPLIYAIQKSSRDLFDFLMEISDLDINYSDFDGMTPLMHAVKLYTSRLHPLTLIDSSCSFDDFSSRSDHYFIFRLLNDSRLEINRSNNYNHNILFYSILKKYELPVQKQNENNDPQGFAFEMAKFPDCFYESINPTITNEIQNKGQSFDNFIKILMSRFDTDLNEDDIFGANLFTSITEKQDLNLFLSLIQNEKFDLNKRNQSGKTYAMLLLEKLCSFEREPVRETARQVKFGSDLGFLNMASNSINDRQMKQSYPKKENSCQLYDNDQKILLSMFKYVLSHPKLEINAQDCSGNTLLMQSVTVSKIRVVNDILKIKNVNLDLQDQDGNTALLLASKSNISSNVSSLVEAGAKIDIKNNEGKTFSDMRNSYQDKQLSLNNNQKKGWLF